jgi:hypothetical protein
MSKSRQYGSRKMRFLYTARPHAPMGSLKIAWDLAGPACISELAMHQYRLVAWRDCDNDLLAPSQRQELLLIRAAISPPEPRAGQKECKVTAQMIQEIKDMLWEPYLLDEDGRMLLSSQTDGKTCAQVPVIMSTALCFRPFPLRESRLPFSQHFACGFSWCEIPALIALARWWSAPPLVHLFFSIIAMR